MSAPVTDNKTNTCTFTSIHFKHPQVFVFETHCTVCNFVFFKIISRALVFCILLKGFSFVVSFFTSLHTQLVDRH